jgi:hypothetical protein
MVIATPFLVDSTATLPSSPTASVIFLTFSARVCHRIAYRIASGAIGEVQQPTYASGSNWFLLSVKQPYFGQHFFHWIKRHEDFQFRCGSGTIDHYRSQMN